MVIAGLWAQVARPVAAALPGVPSPTRWFDAEQLQRVRSYHSPRYVVAAGVLLVDLAVPLLAALTAPGRRAVAALVSAVGQRRRALAAAAIALAIVVGTDLLTLPAAFWSGFVHEHSFGLSTQGAGGWLGDWLKRSAPRWLAAAFLAGAGYRLLRAAPRLWPLLAGLLAAVLSAIVVFASPLVLEPLRHSTAVLEEEPLRSEIEALAARSGIAAERVLVADASRRTTRENAYVSGLGQSRRVVLYDNLLESRPTEQVLMVVAHELGHERNADLARGTLTGSAGVVAACLLLGLVVRWRVATGRQPEPDDSRAAPVLVAVVVLLSVLSMPVQSALSRRAEAAADQVALDLNGSPETFIEMQRGLAISNLSDPAPPGWVRLVWATHPSTAERLARAELAQRP